MQGPRSRFALILETARRDNLTVRQLLRRLAGARGHFPVHRHTRPACGHDRDLVQRGSADGFNVMPPNYAEQSDLFVDEVVPILQRRGLFHTEYPGAR